ncbi:hypothetical protein [Sulfobacillus harzensis]|uniref:Uncharacterized protein n=1 Tax=Sulfobacillus harzensis TaxID=2729629 RepID=A0A7Y0Q3J3_9FIRM|nr:hypothetical protein [Sulfobacillus harzensis]NMP23450.1 hypothetical protein [Sulfobacillus harzensis]
MNKGRRGFSPGHIGLWVLLLGGVWLLIAPSWVGFAGHRLPSRIDEWAGAALIVIVAASLVIQWAFGIGEAAAEAKHDES